MVSKPWFSNILPAIENFSPVDAALSAAPFGIGNTVKALGYKAPTVSQLGQNAVNQGKEFAQGITSKDPKKQFQALLHNVNVVGDLQETPNALPPIGDISAKNTWSPFIKAQGEQGAGVIPNPDYQGGSANPARYTQDTTNADAITSEAGGNGAQPPIEKQPPVTKAQIPQQPVLTAAQQKAFAKSGLDQYKLPSSYGDKRATLEDIDKSVMANVVGGKTPEEVLRKVPQAEQNVWGQVQDKAAGISSIDTEKQVIPHINTQLEKLVNQGIINNAQYQQISNEVGANINAKATDLLAGNPSITGKTLIDLQTGANAKAPASIPAGSSAVAYINKAIADGYRDAVGNVDPGIRYLYNQYSSLKRIGDMSDAFRKTAGLPPTLVDKFKQNPIMGTLAATGALAGTGAIVKDALPLIEGAGGILAGGAQAVSNVGNNLFNKSVDYIAKKEGYSKSSYGSQMNINGGEQDNNIKNASPETNSHGSIVSQPYSKIKPAADGTFALPQTAPQGTNNRHYMSSSDYSGALQQLAQQYPAGDRDPAYTVAKTQLDTQFNQDQKQADEQFKGNNIKNFMDNATQYNDDGNNLIGTLSSLPTDFWNGVGQAKSIKAYTNDQYASQLQQIAAFNNEFSSAYQSVTGKEPSEDQLLTSANSVKQFTAKYIAAMQFINGTYGKYLNPYLALTSATGAQTQQGTSQGYSTALPSIVSRPANPAPQSAPGMMQSNFPALQSIQLPPIQ